MQRAERTGSGAPPESRARVGEGRWGTSYSQLEKQRQSFSADRVKMLRGVGFVTVTLILICCREISGQSLGFGKCPSYPAMKKFDMKKVGNRKSIYYSYMSNHSVYWSLVLPLYASAQLLSDQQLLSYNAKGPLRSFASNFFYISRSNWLGRMIRVTLHSQTCGDNENDISGFHSDATEGVHNNP